MGTSREISLPIKGFKGINRNADRESIDPQNLWSAQNLWENTLGYLETRWNSEELVSSPYAQVDSLGGNYRIYKGANDKPRFVAGYCSNPDFQSLGSLPTGVSLSFVNDAGGFWSKDTTFSTVTWNGSPGAIVLRFVGPGTEWLYEVTPGSISGYSAGTAQKLRVTITSSISAQITGVAIYALVKCGTSVTRGSITTSSNYNEIETWVGFIELVSQRSGTFDFKYVPLGRASSGSVTTAIGDTKRSFTVSASATGGNLQNGKTYYILVLSHHFKCNSTPAGVSTISRYDGIDIDVDGGDIVAITIPGTEGSTGSISVYDISPSTVTALVAIGEHWQMLLPAKIMNRTDDFTSSAPFNITDFPKYSPTAINITHTSGGTQFWLGFGDYSRHDLLIGINDDGSTYPIFASRMSSTFNSRAQYISHISSQVTYLPTSGGFINGFSTASYINFSINKLDQFPRLGTNLEFAQWQNFALGVCGGRNPLVHIEDITTFNIGYLITDGNIICPVVVDYFADGDIQSFPPPVCKYITVFDGSVILSGGSPYQVDHEDVGFVFHPEREAYFSRVNNPFDFTIPGAASAVIQTLSVASDNEEITGLAIYSNTSSDEGMQTQLVIAKGNSLKIFNQLPEADAGALGAQDIRELSTAVGVANNKTLVNTPIGLIMCAKDNVYLIRESGEPAPIGQQISAIIKGADLSRALGCYHDRHYKLSFYHADWPGSAGYNNVEFWLNINKVIEKKGEADWVGPMIGASIDHVFVEDRQGDGAIYNDARNRVCVDRENLRVFMADVKPDDSATQCTDFGVAIESILETKDFEITAQDENWNKLHTRTYYKAKTNLLVASPLDFTEQTYIEGILAETSSREMYAQAAGSFDNQPLRVFPYFPGSRLRGRTLRKVITTDKRIGIAGLTIFYSVERRRI